MKDNRVVMVLCGAKVGKEMRQSMLYIVSYLLKIRVFGYIFKVIHNICERFFLVHSFLVDPVWNNYQLSFLHRIKLMAKVKQYYRKIKGATSHYHVFLYGLEILRVPPTVEGSVIECGCYKGASTAALSLFCDISKRMLYVAHSFTGLPEPNPSDVYHKIDAIKRHREYRKGMYSGSLEEVKQNIANYGVI